MGGVGGEGLIPGLGSCPEAGNCNWLQYSYLGSSMHREPGGQQSVGSQSDTTEPLSMRAHTQALTDPRSVPNLEKARLEA